MTQLTITDKLRNLHHDIEGLWLTIREWPEQHSQFLRCFLLSLQIFKDTWVWATDSTNQKIFENIWTIKCNAFDVELKAKCSPASLRCWRQKLNILILQNLWQFSDKAPQHTAALASFNCVSRICSVSQRRFLFSMPVHTFIFLIIIPNKQTETYILLVFFKLSKCWTSES